MDANESAPADFEPDDDLLESLPADEAGGTGPDEPPDPTQPDDGQAADGGAKAGKAKGRLTALKTHRRTGRPQHSSEQPAYGYRLVVFALLVVLAAYLVTVLHYDTAKDAVTVMGVLTGIVGALVGAYFGVRGATYAQLVNRERSERADRDGDHERHDDHRPRGDEEPHGGDHRDRHARAHGR